MELVELTCRNFRCLSDIAFRPEPGINLIRGNNAQGKTSVLEALLFAATSKSHRTTAEQTLAAYDSESFQVSAHARRSDREVTIEANWWRGTKRFKVNGVAQSRVSDILGKICVVLFTPEDIALIKGSAAVRRLFLDMELSQLHQPYLNALQKYRQVLRQRNELLKAHKVDEDLLSVWDIQLVEHGSQLIEMRTEYVGELSQLASEAYGRIADREVFTLTYQPDIGPSDDFSEVLLRSRASDIRRRQSNRGPHRDDMELLIAGRPARSHGSQGQQKSAALAIKLAEVDLVNRRLKEYPVLMLDEVLSELDESRARRLFSAVDEAIQCIVTTTEVTGRKDYLNRTGADFVIEAGVLKRT